MNEIQYSIVIPVYNSTKSLIELERQIKIVFDNQIKETYEIIFVNDGSPNPKTWEIIKQISKENENVIGVQLSRNFGKEGALLAGFSLAKGNYIITMDDDLQHSPEDIPKLVQEQEHDVVIVAFPKKHHSILQRMTSKARVWFEKKYLKRPDNIQMTPFKLISKKIINEILKIKSVYPYTSGYLYYLTSDIVNVKGSHQPRKYDKSNFNLKKRLKLFSNLLINNTPFLLRLMIKTGIIVSFASFFIGIYYLVRRIIGLTTINGWTSIIVMLSFLSGIIILFIGILGEYILRLIQINENKPAFVIHEVTNR